MASSLSEECTPLKRKYDACFNAWFEGYLEPALSASITPEQRTRFSQEKAAEFERSCGTIWREYRQCVQKAVKDKGLEALLDQARSENPLKDQPPPLDDSRS
ncbi:mitochondrial distribution/morphology family 35/apoptosis [Daedaleopsis nitida]|nr:mitochondrial distribution/morphology family 35/apoptosis [Daedaleopsis nitida]